MEENNFQRIGSTSNTQVGREFQEAVRQYFMSVGVHLSPEFSAPVGIRFEKQHKFDLGSESPPILVECKSYTWTSGGNSPSAKIRGLNEAMLLFFVAPAEYRKVLVILKSMRRGQSLGTHYIKTQGHLIASGVETWEYDSDSESCERVL